MTVITSPAWALPSHLEDCHIGQGAKGMTLGEIASIQTVTQTLTENFLYVMEAHPADGWSVEVAETLAHLVVQLAADMTVTDEACNASRKFSWISEGYQYTNGSYMVGGILLSSLLEREDLPAEALVPLLSGFGEALAGRVGEKMTSAIWMSLARTLQNPILPVSLLGTLWRTLHLFDPAICYRSVGQPILTTRLVENFLANPNLPATVQMRMMEPNPRFTAKHRGYIKVLQKASEEYPELAGLPDQMMWETVAGQPVPEEWLTDWYPLPSSVTVLAPPLRQGI